jgi:PII-like signaling protein
MKRLVIVVSEAQHHGLHALWRELIDVLHQLGIAATATRGLMGFGHSGKPHEGLSPDTLPDLPVTIEAIDEDAAIDRALAAIEARAFEGLIAVHDVQVVRWRQHPRR